MTTLDIAIVAIYLLALFVFAIWTGTRETVEDFLIAGRRMSLPLLIGSVISTWVGTGTTVATAAAGYQSGISLGVTAACGGLLGVVMAARFAPRLKVFGDTTGAHTLGDFFGYRYSHPARLIAGSVIIVVYTLLLAGQFVGISLVAGTWTGVAIEKALIFAALSTIVYTAFAGIKSDFYTDAVHFVLMTVILLVVTPIAIAQSGDVKLATLAQRLPPGHLDLFAFGGTSFFVAGMLFGVAGVFVTMELWQRIYAARDVKSAKNALIASGVVIVLFYLISTFYGLVAKVVAPSLGDPDTALFVVLDRYLGPGLKGLGVAAFLAVCISTVNSMIMVVAATITKDFYVSAIRPAATSRHVLWVGRLTTLGVGIVGLVLAWFIRDIVALTVNSLFSLLVLLPAIAGGFLWPTSTSRAASASICVGVAVSILVTPLAPTQSFVPAFVASAITFIVTSKKTNHSSSERLVI